MSFKTIVGLSALLAFAPLTFAQDTPKPDAPKESKPEAKKETPAQPEGRRRGRRGRRGGGGIERMKETLGLNDEQVKKLTGMFEEMRTSRREMFRKMREEGGGMDRGAMREMMQKAQKEVEKKMGEVLTPEQMEKYKKQREEMRGRRGRRGQRGQRGRRGQRRNAKAQALEMLKLSKDEQAVLEPMIDDIVKAREAVRTKREAFLKSVRENKDAEAIKALLTTFRTERDAARAALKKSQAALLETLTPQQEATLVALSLLD